MQSKRPSALPGNQGLVTATSERDASRRLGYSLQEKRHQPRSEAVKRFRISIARLMGLVLLVAVGLALVLRLQPTSIIGASIIFTLTLVVLMTATLGSLFNRKATWVGFCLFGWCWLFLAFGPLPQSDRTPLPVPLTTMCLKWIATRAYPELILKPDIKAIPSKYIVWYLRNVQRADLHRPLRFPANWQLPVQLATSWRWQCSRSLFRPPELTG